jgi:hypothetical protein
MIAALCFAAFLRDLLHLDFPGQPADCQLDDYAGQLE